MKKIFCLIATLLFLCSSTYAGVAIIGGVPLSAISGPSNPDVYYETFNTASGCDNAPCPTANVTNSSTIDPDDTTNPYGASGESLLLNMNAASDDCYSDAKTVTTQSGEHYIQVRFRVNSITTTFQNIDVIKFDDGSSHYNFYLYIRDDASDLDVTLTSNSGSSQIGEGVTKSAWHHLVAKIPSDGITTISYKLDGGTETAISGTAADYNTANYFYGETAASSAAQIFIDDIGICSAANSANCGW